MIAEILLLQDTKFEEYLCKTVKDYSKIIIQERYFVHTLNIEICYLFKLI
jgi:hypothetical protein